MTYKDGRPTEKQIAARKRNWDICRLRGLKGLAGSFLGPEYKVVQDAIDRQILNLGGKLERDIEQVNSFTGKGFYRGINR